MLVLHRPHLLHSTTLMYTFPSQPSLSPRHAAQHPSSQGSLLSEPLFKTSPGVSAGRPRFKIKNTRGLPNLPEASRPRAPNKSELSVQWNVKLCRSPLLSGRTFPSQCAFSHPAPLSEKSPTRPLTPCYSAASSFRITRQGPGFSNL